MKSKLTKHFFSLQFQTRATVLLLFGGGLIFIALIFHESQNLTAITRKLASTAEATSLGYKALGEISELARARVKYSSLEKNQYLQKYEDIKQHLNEIYQRILGKLMAAGLLNRPQTMALMKSFTSYQVLGLSADSAMQKAEIDMRSELQNLLSLLTNEKIRELEKFEKAMVIMERRIVKALGGMILFVTLFLFMLGRRFLNPLKKLEEGVKSIGKGEFGVQIEVTVENEMGRLSNIFNEMSSNLQHNRMMELRLKKLEVIQQLVRSVNHEINNPLMTIMANAEFLELCDGIPEEMKKEKLQVILREVDRISEITKKLKKIREPVSANYTDELDAMLDLAKSAGTSVEGAAG